jgi:hypothetical protein
VLWLEGENFHKPHLSVFVSVGGMMDDGEYRWVCDVEFESLW